DDDPADTATAGHFLDMRDGTLLSVFLFSRFGKRATCGERSRTALKLLEVIFVHAHPVEFEREAAAQFGDKIGVIFRILLFKRLDFFHYQIDMLNISGVETEMNGNLLFRYALESGEVEFLFFVFFHDK